MEFFFEDPPRMDIRMLFCGEQLCPPGLFWGPGARSHYLLVFVKSGQGIFRIRNRVYHLSNGATFCLFPEEQGYYCADSSDPWEYCWIGLDGSAVRRYLQQADITPENPIHLADKPQPFKSIYRQILALCIHQQPALELRTISLLYELLYRYATCGNHNEEISFSAATYFPYVEQAVEYIQTHYKSPLSVTGVAQEIGISREYLSTLFKQQYGISPAGYIREYRLFCASLLLMTTGLSVAAIAEAVGFLDYNYFSSCFLQNYGMSPSVYRKKGRMQPSSSLSKNIFSED